MATWTAIKQYLISNYKCSPFGDDGLKLVFDVADGRTQLILVDWAGSDAEHATWVDFHSPIGKLGNVDLTRAVSRTRSFVVGGISAIGDIVTLRGSFPLENLDRNEIDDPLNLLVGIADKLEAELTRSDEY